MSRPVRLAMFDFDGTLLNGNTLHILIGERVRHLRHAPKVLGWSALRKARFIGSRRFKEGVLSTLRRCGDDELSALGRGIYERKIRPNLRPLGVRALQSLRTEGFRIVVVTGAFEFLVAPFCEEFPVDDLLCCRLEGDQRGGVTGRINGLELLGSEKPTAVEAYFRGIEVDWQGSVGFTDEIRDLPFLRMVGIGYLLAGGPAGVVETPGIERISW